MITFLNNNNCLSTTNDEALIYLNSLTVCLVVNDGLKGFEIFIIGFSKDIFLEGSFKYLCRYVQRCKCLRALYGDETRQLRGQSKKKTVCRGKAVMNRWKEGRERGRRKRKKMSGFVAIQAATPGLSLPYIRTMNEAFSKR